MLPLRIMMTEKKKTGHRQRLRENFLLGAEISHTEEVVLELLLTYAIPQKDVHPLARQLLTQYGSLSVVLETPMERLIQSEGIKENSAVLLKLVDWIRQNHSVESSVQKTKCHPIQTKLFEPEDVEVLAEIKVAKNKPKTKKVPVRRGTEMFGKAVLKEAVDILPTIPMTTSMEEVTEFLNQNLPFNSVQTRARRGRYIKFNLFSEGEVNLPLLKFARAFPASRDLKDVCFYRFCQAQPLMVAFIEEMMLGRAGITTLSRESIETFLKRKHPESKAIKDCASAIGEALSGVEIVQKKGKVFSFSLRVIPINAFVFVLHSEFPEPGMYDLRKVEENRLMQAMLWNPERFKYTLYELRNQGLISKVSEIDSVRQFTTRYTLDEVVDRMIMGEGGQ